MRTNDFSPTPAGGDGGRRDAYDLDALLHPAQAFEHPMKVVDDSDLTLAEKRAILASWASDACAVEATPALRQPPASPRRVEFDDVMERYARSTDGRARGRARIIGASWRNVGPACSDAGRSRAAPAIRAARSADASSRSGSLYIALATLRSSGLARISAQNTLYFDLGE
jgi:hypothetical protein